MTNTRITVVAGVVLSVALLGSLIGNVAKADTGSLFEGFFKEAAKVFGVELAKEVAKTNPVLPVVESDFVSGLSGAAGDTFTGQRLAQVIIVTSTEALPDTASTTLDQGNLLNPTRANGGHQRLITRLYFVSNSSAATWLGGPLILDFNTTTNAFTSSTRPIFSSTFTTSSNPVVITTSTPTGARTDGWSMIWNPGEYLHCSTNRVVSTTYGTCGADYITVD